MVAADNAASAYVHLSEEPAHRLMDAYDPHDRRHSGRGPKKVRFRFTADGAEHRAVTTNLGLTGGHAKASWVPPLGSTIVMREVYRRGRGVVLALAEIVWVAERPTLSQPDTGFGFRFIELATREGAEAIEEVVRYLAPEATAPPTVVEEEREDGVYRVFYVDQAASLDTDDGEDARVDDATAEEPAEIDLSTELDRLAREERREARASDLALEAARADDPDVAADASPPARKRVTGIFTALFRRKSD